jgi:hypothetical protein
MVCASIRFSNFGFAINFLFCGCRSTIDQESTTYKKWYSRIGTRAFFSAKYPSVGAWLGARGFSVSSVRTPFRVKQRGVSRYSFTRTATNNYEAHISP